MTVERGLRLVAGFFVMGQLKVLVQAAPLLLAPPFSPAPEAAA